MKIRVGLFSKFPPAESGLGVYSKKLADALSAKCKVVKIGFGNSDCDYKIDLSRNFIPDVKSIVEKEKLDVFHFQHTGSRRTFDQQAKNILAAYFNTLMINVKIVKMIASLDIPVVCTIHDPIYNPMNFRDFVMSQVEHWMAKKSDYVIANSTIQKAVIEKYNPNVECIYHGVNIVRKKFKRGKNILSLGVITPAKGWENLINAMKYMPDFNLEIAGQVVDSKYAEKLKNIVMKNNLKNVKIKLGWLSEKEKRRLYEKSNIVALPYLKTSRCSTSGTLNDAISFKIPLVVSNTGSMGDLVRGFGCGIVVNNLSPEELSDAIRKVYQNYKHYASGVDRYRKRANWEKVAEQHLRLYKKLVKNST